MKHFDILPHTRGCYTASAEDIDGVVGDLVRGARGVVFEEGDGAGEVGVHCRGGEVCHLVGEGFEVGLEGFGVSEHFGESGGTGLVLR